MAKLLGRLKSVSDFLNDGLKAFKPMEGGTVFQALVEASPWWLDALGETAKESLPIIGFVIKYAEKLAQGPEEQDAEQQGYIACTLAYSQAATEAFRINAQLFEPLMGASAPETSIKLPSMPEALDLKEFSLKTALSHAFIHHADDVFRGFANGIGLTDEGIVNQLLRLVHRRFQGNLRMLLIAGQFAAFQALLDSDSTDYLSHKALNEHEQYQWWLFNEAKLFRQEPFSLTHIYLPMECGVLKWEQIRSSGKADSLSDKKLLDPFSEKDSDRVDLLKSVLGYIGDSQFNEPIVIQGVAGAGKSTFTLKLVTELIQEGFSPLRICLRHLSVDRPLLEALSGALRFNEQAYKPFDFDPDFDPDWFTQLPRNQERIDFRGSTISPYVLIFDGWDEISTGSTQGFKDAIDDVLNQIRTHFIDQRHGKPAMQVIVTGRPSVDVTKTKLLRKQTPVLTIRPLSPLQLQKYVDRFISARSIQPSLPIGLHSAQEKDFPTKEKAWFIEVFKVYEQGFKTMLKNHKNGRPREQEDEKLAVMGLPLLTYLALRLMSQLETESQLTALIQNPTTLYRVLVDMTYEKGGKHEAATIEDENKYRITGETLRILLWNAAEAITATETEEISREELRLRLPWESEKLRELVCDTTDNNILSRLIISFFFKEGTEEQGCEFLHKSFREYLFAEGVVETLKEYGRDLQVEAKYKHTKAGFLEREVSWKDFGDANGSLPKRERDPRYDLTRRLSEMFATHWLTPEVKKYITDLLEWEVARTKSPEKKTWPGTSTKALNLHQWEYIRDAMADMWDWWAEGVHLRPQPFLQRRRQDTGFAPPYINELIELCAPQDPYVWREKLPWPVRSTTVDARLGEAFFQLTSVIHSQLIITLKLKRYIHSEEIQHRRRYQISITSKEGIIDVVFAPSGGDRTYFNNFCARINAAGLRPEGAFPCQTRASGIFLVNAVLRGADFSGADLIGADLRGANLSRANLSRANLRGANLSRANLSRADLIGADLIGANLIGANLSGADLIGANLIGADLIGANLIGANLREADLIGANLREADLREADLIGANLREADLSGADLIGADLRGADLIGADLSEADLSEADLREANLSEADLSEADLRGADLRGADLSGVVHNAKTTWPADLSAPLSR